MLLLSLINICSSLFPTSISFKSHTSSNLFTHQTRFRSSPIIYRIFIRFVITCHDWCFPNIAMSSPCSHHPMPKLFFHLWPSNSTTFLLHTLHQITIIFASILIDCHLHIFLMILTCMGNFFL